MPFCLLKPSQMDAVWCFPVQANFCRIRAPGGSYGHFFVVWQFDKWFLKLLKIAQFSLGM